MNCHEKKCKLNEVLINGNLAVNRNYSIKNGQIIVNQVVDK